MGRRAAFPFEERARDVERARAEVGRTFSAMRDAGDAAHREDVVRPTVAAWKAAIGRFRAAIDLAYPPGFWEACEALRGGDAAGADTAISFLEADPIFFRSGYLKTRLIAALGHVPLGEDDAERLRRVVLGLVDRRDDREFRRYCRLALRHDAPHLREALRRRLDDDDPGIRRRARWVLGALEGRAGASGRS